MKVYDCFLFADELDLLQLRLHFLDKWVDYFVIVESERTLSGQQKLLYFKEHEGLFKKFRHKIIHIVAPSNSLSAWDYEYYQRNYIKEALIDCKEEDLIHISDVDEIINFKEVLPEVLKQEKPVLIKIPMYYYWFNLKSNVDYWNFNLMARWKDIKDIDIGERFVRFPEIFETIITNDKINTGWHFSYLFGFNIEKYQSKLKAFSHQEFNTTYYLNKERILKCITLGVDLFERSFMSFTYTDKELAPILPFIKQLNLEEYIYHPNYKSYIQLKNIAFLVKNIYPKKLLLYFNKVKAQIKKPIKSILKIAFKKRFEK